MIMGHFNFSRIPEIVFGAGKLSELANLILKFGSNIILFTGASSFKNSNRYRFLIESFSREGIYCNQVEIHSEPFPALINSIVKKYKSEKIDVVVGIGGGSVLDAGKAVSAMMGKSEPVEDFLEGIGTKEHDGSKRPFIAVPTTAGTGSEATKNSVLSKIGKNGFKKSIRHDNFIPDIALVDPELSLGCPSHVTAACGMDAFTQLLESYVSNHASTLTDVLAFNGLQMLKDNLVPASTNKPRNLEVRSAMSYAALLSGITLTNAGLGIVHGLASPIGSYYNIPHGMVCGTLVGAATKINIEILREDHKKNHIPLEKYARVGKLLSNGVCPGVDECCDYLVDHIERWINSLRIPRLSHFGLQNSNIEKIVNETGNKNNPAILKRSDIEKILTQRM